MADGMWHWYKMIVQPGNHTTSRHWTVWQYYTAGTPYGWPTACGIGVRWLYNQETMQPAGIELYGSIIQLAHHMDGRWDVALV
jgi:hypothetical protein